MCRKLCSDKRYYVNSLVYDHHIIFIFRFWQNGIIGILFPIYFFSVTFILIKNFMREILKT